MCNLYSMTRAPEAVRRLFRIGGNRAAAFEPADAIFPGYEAPVVRTAEDGERELVVMRWGVGTSNRGPQWAGLKKGAEIGAKTQIGVRITEELRSRLDRIAARNKRPDVLYSCPFGAMEPLPRTDGEEE